MSDAVDAAKALAELVPVGLEDPRVQEFAEAVVESIGTRPSPQRIGDRLVAFVSIGEARVTHETADVVRKQLLERLPELDDVLVVPGQSVSIHRVGGPP